MHLLAPPVPSKLHTAAAGAFTGACIGIVFVALFSPTSVWVLAPAIVMIAAFLFARWAPGPCWYLMLRRFCPGIGDSIFAGCWIDLRPAGQRYDDKANIIDHLNMRRSPWNIVDGGMVEGDLTAPLRLPQDSIRLREDPTRGLIILDATMRHAFAPPTPDARYWRPTKLLLRDVAATTSPPRGFIAASAAGVLVAVWLQVRRRRAWRHLQDLIARARAGVLGRDGWIVLDDGPPPIHIAPEMRPAPGPVLVVIGTSSSEASSPYRGREPTGSIEILPGKRSNVLARERMALVPLDAQALALLLLTAAPLAAAAQFWLVP